MTDHKEHPAFQQGRIDFNLKRTVPDGSVALADILHWQDGYEYQKDHGAKNFRTSTILHKGITA